MGPEAGRGPADFAAILGQAHEFAVGVDEDEAVEREDGGGGKMRLNVAAAPEGRVLIGEEIVGDDGLIGDGVELAIVADGAPLHAFVVEVDLLAELSGFRVQDDEGDGVASGESISATMRSSLPVTRVEGRRGA